MGGYASQRTYLEYLAEDSHPFGRGRINTCYRLIELTAILFTVIVVFPLSAFIGAHVQIISEDFLMGLFGAFL